MLSVSIGCDANSSVFLIKGQNQYLGYVWCNRHENQLNIPEYAIDTTLPEK